MAQSQDYAAFYQQEIQFRREAAYPPFVRLINLLLESNSESGLRKYAQALEARVQGILKRDKRYRGRWRSWTGHGPPGPAERKAPLPDALQGRKWDSLHEFTEQVIGRIEEEIPGRGVKLTVDVDPVHML